jgi:hypothetical protein
MFGISLGVVLMILFALPTEPPPAPGILLLEGDIVLQSSIAEQEQWLERATASPYSHMGILQLRDGIPWVVEVADSVTHTPWGIWWKKGREHKVAILRVTSLTPADSKSVVKAAESFIGKPPDPKLNWDDDHVYDAELVEKAFDRGAHIALGQMQRLDSLHLDGLDEPLKSRFGGSVPGEQLVITPASIAADPQLTVVWTSFSR